VKSRLTSLLAWLVAQAARLAPGMVPTPLALALLVALGLVALVVGTVAPQGWMAAPLVGGMVLGLALVDSVLAGRLVDAQVLAPAETEIGQPTAITLHAQITGRPRQLAGALALDPRLAHGGRLNLPLQAKDGAYAGHASLAPHRRCQGAITALWLSWRGPLGLGARLYRRECEAAIRVLPNIAPLRSPALQTFLRDSQFGMIARRLRGEGTLFETLAEYQPGMDRRRIDWKVSARHGLLHAKEYEAERNNQIVFAIDCGQAMCEPVGASPETSLPRLDRAITAALTTAWIALKAGDRCALFGFGAGVRLSTPFAAAQTDFGRLRSAAATLDYEPREPNFTLAMASLAQRLQRRSLIIVLSDFTDPTGAELMVESVARLIKRHKVLFVTLRDDELDGLASAEPIGMEQLATSVAADALLRQRALVTSRLRQMGVDVVEAPHAAVGPRLIDAYLAIKRQGSIG
jgi:uncharacterized protein (DUF58 family)